MLQVYEDTQGREVVWRKLFEGERGGTKNSGVVEGPNNATTCNYTVNQPKKGLGNPARSKTA